MWLIQFKISTNISRYVHPRVLLPLLSHGPDSPRFYIQRGVPIFGASCRRSPFLHPDPNSYCETMLISVSISICAVLISTIIRLSADLSNADNRCPTLSISTPIFAAFFSDLWPLLLLAARRSSHEINLAYAGLPRRLHTALCLKGQKKIFSIEPPSCARFLSEWCIVSSIWGCFLWT